MWLRSRQRNKPILYFEGGRICVHGCYIRLPSSTDGLAADIFMGRAGVVCDVYTASRAVVR